MKFSGRPVSILATAVLLSPILLSSLRAEDGNEKTLPPSPAAQKEPLAVINEVYGAEQAALKTNAERSAFAKKLIATAADSTDPPNRYCLLQVALDVALEAADPRTANDAVEQIAGKFQVDPLDIQTTALQTAAKKARLPSHHAVLAIFGFALLDQAIARDDFQLGKTLLEISVREAQSARNADILKNSVNRQTDFEEVSVAYQKVKETLEKLDNAHNDAAANLTLGRYYCLLKGDWSRGIPLLALGSDDELRAIAQAELRKPSDNIEQAKLGDRYWLLAESKQGRAQKNIQARAALWYQRARPGLSGLTKAKIEKRLSEQAPSLDGAIPEPPEPVSPRTDGSNDKISVFRATVINYNPATQAKPNYGWYTRTGNPTNNPSGEATKYLQVRQLVIKWNGAVIYNGNGAGVVNGSITVGDYTYTSGKYRGTQYGWPSDGTSAGPAASPEDFSKALGDSANAFDVSRVSSKLKNNTKGLRSPRANVLAPVQDIVAPAQRGSEKKKIDLLVKISVEKDVLHGSTSVERKGRAIVVVTEGGQPDCVIELPHSPNTPYALEMDVTRLSSYRHGIAARLTFGKGACETGIDGRDQGKPVSAISAFTNGVPHSLVRVDDNVIPAGHRTTVRWEVSGDGITAIVDGKQLMKWAGNPSQLRCDTLCGKVLRHPTNLHIAVATNTAYEISRIEVSSISPGK